MPLLVKINSIPLTNVSDAITVVHNAHWCMIAVDLHTISGTSDAEQP
jgi:hypothetical protein